MVLPKKRLFADVAIKLNMFYRKAYYAADSTYPTMTTQALQICGNISSHLILKTG